MELKDSSILVHFRTDFNKNLTIFFPVCFFYQRGRVLLQILLQRVLIHKRRGDALSGDGKAGGTGGDPAGSFHGEPIEQVGNQGADEGVGGSRIVYGPEIGGFNVTGSFLTEDPAASGSQGDDDSLYPMGKKPGGLFFYGALSWADHGQLFGVGYGHIDIF